MVRLVVTDHLIPFHSVVAACNFSILARGLGCLAARITDVPSLRSRRQCIESGGIGTFRSNPLRFPLVYVRLLRFTVRRLVRPFVGDIPPTDGPKRVGVTFLADGVTATHEVRKLRELILAEAVRAVGSEAMLWAAILLAINHLRSLAQRTMLNL
jgi:hypothetical protein